MTPTLSQLLCEPDDALNRRLAELYGFRNIELYEDNAGPSIWVGDPPKHRPLHLGRPNRPIPNYCDPKHGHNAVAEVRGTLNENQSGDYINHLCNVVKSQNDGPGTAVSKAFFAKPRQITIALILALSDQ